MTSSPLRWPALLLALLLASCADDAAPEVEVPSWAKVSDEQIAEAKKHGVPVAFENNIGMRFVLIPAGTFLWGAPEQDDDWRYSEGQREEAILDPFYISIYEVRSREYSPFHHDVGGRWHRPDTMGTHPAVGMPGLDMLRYASWLTGRDSARSYRLPTEVEWECACRAGTTTAYSFGDDTESIVRYGNVADASAYREGATIFADPSIDDGHAGLAPVGSYRPNPWGLYDMHGNAGEVCLATSDTSPRARYVLIHRGGGHHGEAASARSYRRSQRDLTSWGSDGFRLVSPLPEKAE